MPEHVTASATFLGLVYPGRGLEKSVRKEHLDNMTTADFIKVWKASAIQQDTSLASTSMQYYQEPFISL